MNCLSAAWLHSLGLPEYWTFLSSLQGAAKLRTGNQPETQATGEFQDQTSIHLQKFISSPEVHLPVWALSNPLTKAWKTQRILILSFSPALIKP